MHVLEVPTRLDTRREGCEIDRGLTERIVPREVMTIDAAESVPADERAPDLDRLFREARALRFVIPSVDRIAEEVRASLMS